MRTATRSTAPSGTAPTSGAAAARIGGTTIRGKVTTSSKAAVSGRPPCHPTQGEKKPSAYRRVRRKTDETKGSNPSTSVYADRAARRHRHHRRSGGHPLPRLRPGARESAIGGLPLER